MIDAQEGLQKQDLNIFTSLKKLERVVVLVNKWDLIDKDQNTVKKYEDKIREQLAPFNDVPIIFTSTVTKQRIHKAIESAMTVFENRIQKIPTSKLNDVMLDVVHSTPPPSVKGKYIKIKFISSYQHMRLPLQFSAIYLSTLLMLISVSLKIDCESILTLMGFQSKYSLERSKLRF